MAGLAQDEDEAVLHKEPRTTNPANKPTAASPVIRYNKQKATNLAMLVEVPESKHNDNRVFPTHPMPNVYRGDNCVPMPNAYVGDNCVPIPNVYGGKIIEYRPIDSITAERLKEKIMEYHALDSLTMDQLNGKLGVPKK